VTIVNSAAITSPGFGSPYVVSRLGVALSGTGEGTTTIPSSGSLSPTCRTAILNIKIFTGTGTSPTVSRVHVNATDGTTTEEVYEYKPGTAFALTSAQVVHLQVRILLDINATSVSVLTTLGGTGPGATLDVELAYEP